MRSYIVQPGDTLGQIAARFGTTVQALVELNHIPDEDLIRIGQQLQIPDGGGIGGAGGGSAGGGAGGFQRDPSISHVFPVVGYSGLVHLHHGVHPGGSDLFATEGTPVVAMSGGRVTLVGTEATDQFGGNNVMIDGSDGLTYYYAHGKNNPAVATGQTVVTGQFLFGVGDTGNARGTGHHLHIGIGHGIQDGIGPAGGTGRDFNAVELMRTVLNGQSPTPVRVPRSDLTRRRFQVFNTGHLGLRVRAQPSHSATIVGGFPDGTVMDGEDRLIDAEMRLWRPVSSPALGFAADEFLRPVDVPASGGPTPRGILSVEQLFALVRRHGAGDTLDAIMVAAALVESGGNTEAVGDNGHSIGLWQMHDQGLGHGMSREARHDPDTACAKMTPEFKRNFDKGRTSEGHAGDTLAAYTYIFTERPFGFPSLESDAALRFLARYRSVK